MLATISWSLELLTTTERLVMGRLATFYGGFTLAAAAAICTDLADEDAAVVLVTSLVKKSLINAAHDETVALFDTGIDAHVYRERRGRSRRHASWLPPWRRASEPRWRRCPFRFC